MTREQRRSKVFELINLGTDEKRAVGKGYSGLVELFSRALELALTPDPLHEPFPAILRYRLAMVRFESARSREELEAVEQLLEQVANSGAATRVFGMMPTLYHVAVLYRIAELREVRVAEKNRLRELARRRLREAGALAVASARATSAPPLEDPDQDSEASRYAGAGIQGPDYNLLELAARFLGAPHPVIGFDPDERRCPLGRGWLMVGTQGVDCGIVISETMGETEFAARVREGVDLAFILRGNFGQRSGVVVRADGTQIPVQAKHLLTLALLCRYERWDLARLQRLTASDPTMEPDAQALRSFVSEFRKFLGSQLGEPRQQWLPDQPNRNQCALLPTLRVVGLVEVTALPPDQGATHG